MFFLSSAPGVLGTTLKWRISSPFRKLGWCHHVHVSRARDTNETGSAYQTSLSAITSGPKLLRAPLI